jgi:HNH endonuclease
MAKAKTYPSIERIKEVIGYDPITGIFIRKLASKTGQRFIGMPTGYKRQNRNKWYWYVRIDGEEYSAHKIAFMIIRGRHPYSGMEIDHDDGDGLNNVWSNLREATTSQNQGNQGIPSNNTSGYKGVQQVGNRWSAVIYKDRIQYRLGRFDTVEEAAGAYRLKSIELYGQFARSI